MVSYILLDVEGAFLFLKDPWLEKERIEERYERFELQNIGHVNIKVQNFIHNGDWNLETPPSNHLMFQKMMNNLEEPIG